MQGCFLVASQHIDSYVWQVCAALLHFPHIPTSSTAFHCRTGYFAVDCDILSEIENPALCRFDLTHWRRMKGLKVTHTAACTNLWASENVFFQSNWKQMGTLKGNSTWGAFIGLLLKIEMWGLWTFTRQVECNEKMLCGLKYEEYPHTQTQLPCWLY